MKTLVQTCLMAVSLTFSILPGAAWAQGAAAAASPDMKGILDTLSGMSGKPIETLDPVEARKHPTMADAMVRLMMARGQDVNALKTAMGVTTTDGTYKAATDNQPARIYRPAAEGTNPLPVILYIHGGGWVTGSIDAYDYSARALAKKTGAMVVSIEYRHAPEFKFPAAHEDAFAAYKWLLDNAVALNGDPTRIAIVGESAGANMAANVAILARDQGIDMPLHLGLIYPVAGSDMNTPSYIENAYARPLNKALMEWFVKYTFDKPEQVNDKRIDLTHADLKGLPPATIITAQIDPLRSDGEMLADAMQKAGDSVTIQDFTGVTHEFFGLDGIVIKAGKAQDLLAGELRKAFDQNGDQSGNQ